MEEEREAWQKEVEELGKKLHFGNGRVYENKIANYWLSRMDEKIEETYKESADVYDRAIKIAVEQGKQEEKARIVKMIEAMPTVDGRISEDYLLDQLKSDE